jgi:hypothetical protein
MEHDLGGGRDDRSRAREVGGPHVRQQLHPDIARPASVATSNEVGTALLPTRKIGTPNGDIEGSRPCNGKRHVRDLPDQGAAGGPWALWPRPLYSLRFGGGRVVISTAFCE